MVKIVNYPSVAAQTPTQKVTKPSTPATFPVADQQQKVPLKHQRTDLSLIIVLLQKGKSGKGGKGNGTGTSTPFRRVEGDIKVDPRLVDNSFEAKVTTFIAHSPLVHITHTHTHTTGRS